MLRVTLYEMRWFTSKKQNVYLHIENLDRHTYESKLEKVYEWVHTSISVSLTNQDPSQHGYVDTIESF